MESAGVEARVWKGVAVLCKLSEDNISGYKNVNKLRDSKKGPVWQAKFVPAGEKKQRGLPGSCSLLKWEAAAALAYYEAGHGDPLPDKKKYIQRRSSDVRAPARPCSCLCSRIPFLLSQEKRATDIAIKLEKHVRKTEKLQKIYNQRASAASSPLCERTANESPGTGPPVMLTPLTANSPLPGMPMAFPLPMPINWGSL